MLKAGSNASNIPSNISNAILDGMLDEKKKENFCKVHLRNFIQHRLLKIVFSFILKFKMAEAEDFATMIVLNKLMNREDEKPKKRKRKSTKWVKRLKERGVLTKVFRNYWR